MPQLPSNADLDIKSFVYGAGWANCLHFTSIPPLENIPSRWSMVVVELFIRVPGEAPAKVSHVFRADFESESTRKEYLAWGRAMFDHPIPKEKPESLDAFYNSLLGEPYSPPVMTVELVTQSGQLVHTFQCKVDLTNLDMFPAVMRYQGRTFGFHQRFGPVLAYRECIGWDLL